MFNSLSKDTKKIWELMEKDEKEIYGTNDLLKVLINLKGGMFSIITSDYNIDLNDLNEYIDNTLSISYEEGKYTKKLLEVYNYSEKIAKKNNEEIYEEHLIYALLKIKGTIAYEILKSYIKDIDLLAEEYNQIFDLEKEDTILVNLSRVVKTKKDKFIGRTNLIDRVVNIISKKKKNNPLLIGNAGVGKSSLVEEVAKVFLKTHPEYTVYSLDVAGIIAGTKYRGDLEEKLLSIIEEVKKPYTILFIDEIHNIVKKEDDGHSLDIGNILKPILSRGEITLIGATTLDEYYSSIDTDKALARRFTNVFIDEASQSEAITILKGIKKEYEKHYKIKYSDKIIKYIVSKSMLIPNRYLPDKAIDILDEAGLLTKVQKTKEVTIELVDRVIFNYLGQDIIEIKDHLNKKIKFPKLKYYINNYILGISDKKQIGIFKSNSSETTKVLIEDLKQIFNLKDEMILNINMSRYKTTFELSNLLGSSKGYVGYSSGGLISEHLIKYPFNILIFKNLSEASVEVTTQIETIISSGEFIDNKSRKISMKNTIVIIEEEKKEKKQIGFIGKDNSKKETLIDEEFSIMSFNYLNELLELINNLSYHNYTFSFKGKDLNYTTYENIKTKLLDINMFEKNKEYTINEDGTIIF